MKEEYARFRENFNGRQKVKEYLTLAQARHNKYQADFSRENIIKPKEMGIQILPEVDLKILVDFIDWAPFFRSWDLHGRYQIF